MGFIPDQKSVVGTEGQTVSPKVYLDGCNRRSVRVGVAIEHVTASGVCVCVCVCVCVFVCVFACTCICMRMLVGVSPPVTTTPSLHHHRI